MTTTVFYGAPRRECSKQWRKEHPIDNLQFYCALHYDNLRADKLCIVTPTFPKENGVSADPKYNDKNGICRMQIEIPNLSESDIEELVEDDDDDEEAPLYYIGLGICRCECDSAIDFDSETTKSAIQDARDLWKSTDGFGTGLKAKLLIITKRK